MDKIKEIRERNENYVLTRPMADFIVHAPEDIDYLLAELERAEFLLKQEQDAYGSDVLDILEGVSEGRTSKMKAHQLLNKYYKVRFKNELERVQKENEELNTKINLLMEDDRIHNEEFQKLQRSTAEQEEK